jgi:signal transduction histidine kinase
MLSEIQSRHAEREQTMHERERLLFREQELRRQAEETNRLKDEFLAVLSHELRTPLTAIVGWAALLRAGKLAPDKIQKGLETIDRNAQEQGRLINDLLDVSGIISGKIGLNWASANAQRILKAAVDTIRPAADLKRIVVSLDEATEPAQLECDPNRLLQAFGNILSNAVKFTQNGGRIGIDVHASAEQVCITITDSGIGIPADFLPYVFDRFRQADSSSTRHYGGLGLGLSISRNIVELHGGVIRASSDGPNRGASFTIELPRSRAYLREA